VEGSSRGLIEDDICLEKPWKTTVNLNKDGQYSDWDLNSGHLEYEADVLTAGQHCSIVCYVGNSSPWYELIGTSTVEENATSKLVKQYSQQTWNPVTK
jgi:hypothetical protein